MNRTLMCVALMAIILAPGVAGAEEGKINYAEILKAKSPTVVTVKFVNKIRVSMMGMGQQEQEQNQEATGMMVDPTGLVMISNSDLTGGVGGMIRGLNMKSTPSKFKVVFPGDEKEYDAILGAKDSKLNLAFVRIKDLAGKQVKCLDLANVATAEVGQELVGVDRFGKGFDYAPFFGRALVTGEIKQPRHMFSLTGGFAGEGLALYNKEGKAV
ncbi:MAG: hypothetical protein ACYTHM_13080, partial [Planctomycetota bacterium]